MPCEIPVFLKRGIIASRNSVLYEAVSIPTLFAYNAVDLITALNLLFNSGVIAACSIPSLLAIFNIISCTFVTNLFKFIRKTLQ